MNPRPRPEPEIDDLLTERIERDAFTSVDGDAIARWLEVFGDGARRHDPSVEGVVAPPAMVTTFLRPPVPPAADAPIATNVALHERLKSSFGLPVGIATGYELECHVLLEPEDRLHSVERVAEIGAERDTRFGRGRDWVIEVASSIVGGRRSGRMACIERWRMTGYDPARMPERSGASAPTVASHEITADDAHRSTIEVTRESILEGATANRVWAPAHHHDDAARAAGLPGIILDTSSWVAITSAHAGATIGGDPRLGSVDLTMRRPVLAGDTVELEGVLVADAVDGADVRWATVLVTARVRELTAATAEVRLAAAVADGTEVWSLTGERWIPGRS